MSPVGPESRLDCKLTPSLYLSPSLSFHSISFSSPSVSRPPTHVLQGVGRYLLYSNYCTLGGIVRERERDLGLVSVLNWQLCKQSALGGVFCLHIIYICIYIYLAAHTQIQSVVEAHTHKNTHIHAQTHILRNVCIYILIIHTYIHHHHILIIHTYTTTTY